MEEIMDEIIEQTDNIVEQAMNCQQYHELYGGSFAMAFIEGATARKRFDIKKSCEWLENKANDYIIADTYKGKTRYIISSKLIDDFRDAIGHM